MLKQSATSKDFPLLNCSKVTFKLVGDDLLIACIAWRAHWFPAASSTFNPSTICSTEVTCSPKYFLEKTMRNGIRMGEMMSSYLIFSELASKNDWWGFLPLRLWYLSKIFFKAFRDSTGSLGISAFAISFSISGRNLLERENKRKLIEGTIGERDYLRLDKMSSNFSVN